MNTRNRPGLAPEQTAENGARNAAPRAADALEAEIEARLAHLRHLLSTQGMAATLAELDLWIAEEQAIRKGTPRD